MKKLLVSLLFITMLYAQEGNTTSLKRTANEAELDTSDSDEEFQQEAVASSSTNTPTSRRYACRFKDCGKTFEMKGTLAWHQSSHASKKTFKCSICGESFLKNFNLTQHMQTHTGEKPFKCNMCEQSFAQKGNLNVHVRTHTGEKPFKCSTCGESFSRNTGLTKHIRTRHSDAPLTPNKHLQPETTNLPENHLYLPASITSCPMPPNMVPEEQAQFIATMRAPQQKNL